MAGQVVCVDNIGPREVRKRFMLGVVLAVLSLGAAAGLVALSVGPLWRGLLFVPATLGVLGMLQARART